MSWSEQLAVILRSVLTEVRADKVNFRAAIVDGLHRAVDVATSKPMKKSFAQMAETFLSVGFEDFKSALSHMDKYVRGIESLQRRKGLSRENGQAVAIARQSIDETRKILRNLETPSAPPA